MSHETSVAKRVSDSLRPAYRAAALAYRSMRQQGYMDLEASRAATAAVCEVLPEIPADEAAQIARNAIGYASTSHSGWF